MDEYYLKYRLDSLNRLTKRFIADCDWKDCDYFYGYTNGLITAVNWINDMQNQIEEVSRYKKQNMEEKNED